MALAASSGVVFGLLTKAVIGVEDRAAILLQDGHVVGHRAHQRSVGDRGLQGLQRLLLTGVEVLEIDVEAGGNRALGLIEHGLELRRHDQMRQQRLAGDVVGVLLLEEDDRVRIEDEARLAPVGRRLPALVVLRRLQSGRGEDADLPVAHDHERGLTLGDHAGRGVVVAAGDARIHVFRHHQAHLLERLDHVGRAHRLGVALDEGLAEQIDVLPVDDHLERRRVGPVLAEMGEADEMGRDRLVAVGVEFGPGLRQFLDPRLIHGLGRAPDPVDAVDVHRRGDPVAGRLHHRQQFGRDDLVPAFLAGKVVEIGGHAGLVPLGDFRTLELHGGRRVAGDHVGAQFRQRVGGVPRDRGLFPFSPGGGEHLAELGDRGRVGAFRPLAEQVCLGFGQRRSRRRRGDKGGRDRRLDREHRFSPSPTGAGRQRRLGEFS